MRVSSWELSHSAILSVSCFHVILGLPGQRFPSNCMSKAVLTAPLEHYTCPYQRSLLSFRMRSRSSMPSRTSSSLDVVVTMSCSLMLQICLIIALSFRCSCWRFDFINGTKSHWHGTLHSAQKSCTRGHMSCKRGGRKRESVAAPWTSSRRFSRMLWLKVHSHQLLTALLLGSKRRLPSPVCQVQLGLPFVVCYPSGMQFPGTVYFCNQGSLSSAWAYCISCASSACNRYRRCCCCPLQHDRAWKLAWTLQEIQACTTDHDLHLSCIYSQSFLLYCFFPNQEPPDTFLEWFSNDNKVISIERSS